MANRDFKRDVGIFWPYPALVASFKATFSSIRLEEYSSYDDPEKVVSSEILPFFKAVGVGLNPNRELMIKDGDYDGFLKDIISGIKPLEDVESTPRGKNICAALLAWMSWGHKNHASRFWDAVAYHVSGEANGRQYRRDFEPIGTGISHSRNSPIPKSSSMSAASPYAVCVLCSNLADAFTASLVNYLERARWKVRMEPIAVAPAQTLKERLASGVSGGELGILIIDVSLAKALAAVSSDQSRPDTLAELIGNGKLLPVLNGVERQDMKHIIALLSGRYPLDWRSGVDVCGDTISRAIFRLGLGHAEYTKHRDSIDEKEAGRKFLEEKLQSRIFQKRKGRSPYIVMSDIDKMNQINRKFGDDVGNKVIEATKNILKSFVSGRPHEFGRCGDDTFYIVVYEPPRRHMDSSIEEIRLLAQKVADHPWHTLAHGLKVSCSLGIARKRDDEDAIDAVIRAAIAMNSAKDKGGSHALRGPDYLPFQTKPELRDLFS